MIITVKPGRSGFVQYATNREDAAFTIIEGEPLKMDLLANQILNDFPNRAYSHYSYVLSFKEEGLTKDDLYQYYLSFKEKMFCNYDTRELEFLSVIHWDDNKPHIHVYVLNASTINGRDLRLYRGYADFKRVLSIQENINYEYSLESVFDNAHLFKLTKEQKQRNWRHKKGAESGIVFDDLVEENFREFILASTSFNDFIEKIEKKYGRVKVQKFDKITGDGLSEMQILQEHSLSMLDQPLEKGGGLRRFSSKLYNAQWFNQNLPLLKKKLESSPLSSLTYKNSEKLSQDAYDFMFQATTSAHAQHLLERKVGKEYLKANLSELLVNELGNIAQTPPIDGAEDFYIERLERWFSLCTAKELDFFLKEFDYDSISIMDGYVLLQIKGKHLRIFEENIYQFLKNGQIVSSDDKEDAMHLHHALLEACENLSSNKNKAIAREALEHLFYSKRIKNKEEFENLLAIYGLSIKRINIDKRKGRYISLVNEDGISFSIYNDVLYALVNDGISPEDHEAAKSAAIESVLLKSYINNYTQALCAELLGRGRYVHTIDDYRLKDSPIKDYAIKGENGNNVYYEHFFNNRFEEILDEGRVVTIKKTLDEKRSAHAMADLFYMKGSTRILLDVGTKEFRDALIERIREKGYPIAVIDGVNTLYEPATLEASFDVEKILATARTRAKDVITHFNVHGSLVALYQNPLSKRSEVEEARAILGQAAAVGRAAFTALADTLDISFERVGQDREKGKYVTFSFKGKKIAVYDDALYALYKEGDIKSFVPKPQNATEEAVVDALNEIKHPLRKTDILMEGQGGGVGRKNDAYYKSKYVRCLDKGDTIDVSHVGDYSHAAKELLELALKNGWKGILVKENEMAAAVHAAAKVAGVAIPVYDKSGMRIGDVDLSEPSEDGLVELDV